MALKTFFIIVQILISLLLIVLISLQSKGGGLGTAFGVGQTLYSKRRGVEKLVFYLTIVLSVLFLMVSLSNLLLL